MPLMIYPGFMEPGTLIPVDLKSYSGSDFADPANEPWHSPDPSDDALSAQPTWDMEQWQAVPVVLTSYAGSDFNDPAVDNQVDPADDILPEPFFDVATEWTLIPVDLRSYSGTDFDDPSLDEPWSLPDPDDDALLALSLFDSDPWTNQASVAIVWDSTLDWLDAFDPEDNPDADILQPFDDIDWVNQTVPFPDFDDFGSETPPDPDDDAAIAQPLFAGDIDWIQIPVDLGTYSGTDFADPAVDNLADPDEDASFAQSLYDSDPWTNQSAVTIVWDSTLDWLDAFDVEDDPDADLPQYFDSDPWADQSIPAPDYDDLVNSLADDPDADAILSFALFDSDSWVDHAIDIPQYFDSSTADQPFDEDDLSLESSVDPGIDTLADQAAAFNFTDTSITDEEDPVLEFNFEPWIDYTPIVLVWTSTLDYDDWNNECGEDPDVLLALLSQPMIEMDVWTNIPPRTSMIPWPLLMAERPA